MKLFTSIAAASALLAVFTLSAPSASATTPLRVLEARSPVVTIGSNGTALVRGAEIDSITDGVITATTAWDNASWTWTIETDSDTDFVGVADELSDLDEGDEISFSGELTGSTRVEADAVRLWPDETSPKEDGDDHDKGKGNDKPSFWKFGDFWEKFSGRFHK